MNVYEALKQQGVRLTNGNRWIVWDDETNEWKLYEHFYRHSGGTFIDAAETLDELISTLLAGE